MSNPIEIQILNIYTDPFYWKDYKNIWDFISIWVTIWTFGLFEVAQILHRIYRLAGSNNQPSTDIETKSWQKTKM